MEDNYLLDQEEAQDIFLPEASKGLRFANLLLDQLAVMVLLVPLILFLPESFIDSLLFNLFAYAITFIYYGVFETATKGKTLGKYITKTQAVRIDGSELDQQDALLRTLCRLIPFNALSFFGENGWHDRFSKTKVVKLN